MRPLFAPCCTAFVAQCPLAKKMALVGVPPPTFSSLCNSLSAAPPTHGREVVLSSGHPFNRWLVSTRFALCFVATLQECRGVELRGPTDLNITWMGKAIRPGLPVPAHPHPTPYIQVCAAQHPETRPQNHNCDGLLASKCSSE
ncbi:hypothetical protein SKAU_G00377270 [Synaphobranchus kaupii]|uniref:Uncharacterized protein n=1 Tax=Synaphobranchus kaupii TaxID=118154 RepID=A0A9Q1ECY3_SYNKA|nr:hypothetical protein SKAU_G00377270 [Synaphobranchus kaupii]